MKTHPTITKLLEQYHPVWALQHVSTLAGWDLETYIPEHAVTPRGFALGKIQSLIKYHITSSATHEALQQASAASLESDADKAIVRQIQRMYDDYTKLPTKFLETFEETVQKAQVVWREARKNNDITRFAPLLEKLVALSKQKADYLGYQEHPYDALADQFEENITTKDITAYFEGIAPTLQQVLTAQSEKKDFGNQHPFKQIAYDKKIAETINQKLLELLLAPKQRLRLDESTHPFTESMMSKFDTRITTRYEGTHIASTLLSTIHEFGHALYELQTKDELEYSPLRPASLGLHESQSRFWENIVGKNPYFIERYIDLLRQAAPEFASLSTEKFVPYLNHVSPGLIRVDADEVTYHYHILIRFEIEKALFENEIETRDIEAVWNEKYKKYLDITPPNVQQGVLQDIHWSMGAFGYFSTYSTGTVLSASWKKLIEQELGSIDTLVEHDEGIAAIQKWLQDTIHQYGSIYPFHDLITKATGEGFSYEPWEEYITAKYI